MKRITLWIMICIMLPMLVYAEKTFDLTIRSGQGGYDHPSGSWAAESYRSAWYLNLEAGINIRLLWKFGIYGVYKYMYAYRETPSVLIDFNEHIILLGLTFNFKL